MTEDKDTPITLSPALPPTHSHIHPDKSAVLPCMMTNRKYAACVDTAKTVDRMWINCML